MTVMSVTATVTQIETCTYTLSAGIVTDPPGRSECPAILRPRLAIHVGRSVYMACQHGRKKHRGWGVHGDIDIVPAGTPCIWEPKEHDTALIVSLDSECLEKVAEELGLHGSRPELVDRFQIRDPQIENICWALKAEIDAGYPSGRLFLDSLATALAVALLRRHSSLPAAPGTTSMGISGRRLRRALAYIEDNLTTDLSLREIADIVGVSVSQLKRAFRQSTGVPVHQYVIQRRVERAKALLCGSSLSIKDVAHESGFAHQSHLANQMRRILGLSPKEIRGLNA
ncbi:MAG: helix-turn-helix transcriptional regulator [Acidobacteriaceae bacterium]|nr:helix-turn-helix transcriptional regulator [Acidobacteriaceae bacterium]